MRGIARLMGGDTTVFNPDLPFDFIGNASLFGVPWLAIIALVVIVASWFVLRRTVLGVRIYAVGGNPAAARLSGIKVWAILLFVYCLSGLLAGLGGVMSAARLYAANGLQIGQGYELDAIAAVILGGTSFVGGIGSIWGTLVGAPDHRRAHQRSDPDRRLRHLAVHHQGPGDHRCGGARPLPAAGQRQDLIGFTSFRPAPGPVSRLPAVLWSAAGPPRLRTREVEPC